MALDHAAAARRLQVAMELFEAGVAMMRQRIRREHPAWLEAEVEARLSAWLQERPGAEHGDAAGRPVPWPRSPR